MNGKWIGTGACCAVASIIGGMSGSYAQAQTPESATIQAATAVLHEAMATPGNRIPQSMLANAHGVAIIPKVLKGGFVIGARHGRGVLFVRQPDGVWNAPVFITLTGGNIGWQVGVQSSDIILVFKTQKSVQGILSGKLTIGADAAAAAGPLGRQGSVGTDGTLQAEIYSYSRSRGLFAGVSVDGSVLSIDSLAAGRYYGPQAPGQPPTVPPAAQALTQTIATITGAAPAPPQLAASRSALDKAPLAPTDQLSQQLAAAVPVLDQVLDQQWQNYLAMPTELLQTGADPDVATLDALLQRYQAVASDPRYRSLAGLSQFQTVYALLQQYRQALSSSQQQMVLPPPPTAAAPAVP